VNAADPDDRDVPAGEFSAWLAAMQAALRGERSADVPCGDCTACCRSSQFVHIGPDETDTLAHIPSALLFAAPRLPKGHVLMGHDDEGRCPMLVDDRCTIYEHRPRTCRTYDCRVFPAAGVMPDDEPAKGAIAERARRWRFAESDDDARLRHEAVRAAARFVREHHAAFPADAAPVTTTQLAVAAVALHELFLGTDPASGRGALVEPMVEAVGVRLRR
jgi:Fe-S-cluster containining protein